MSSRDLASNQKHLRSNPSNNYDSGGFGKLPPQDLELESVVLGAMLISPESVEIATGILSADDFYKESHQIIFEAISDLFGARLPTDILAVTRQLRKLGKIEIVGGGGYVSELTFRVNSSNSLEYHSRLLKEFSIKRQLIQFASTLLRDSYEDTTDTFELLDRSEVGLLNISGKITTVKDETFASQIRKTIEDMARVKKTGLAGLPSSYQGVNRLIKGYQAKSFYLIGARPAMGKSLYMINEAISLAYAGIAVDIWSLEMSDIQQSRRILSLVTGINNERIMAGDLTDEEMALVLLKEQELARLRINLYDATNVPISEIRRKSRRNRAKGECEILFIDYLQLITPETQNKGGYGNKNLEISQISVEMKQTAKELGIPVVALAQLSRAVETRGGDKVPMLSDLRDSGSLEQDADCIQFLYRPFYYNIFEDDDGLPTKDVIEVHTAKNREGRLEKVVLKYVPEISAITEFYTPPEIIENVGF